MDLIPETDKIDMAYLKSDKIGKVLIKGLADVYKQQPQYPIEYLATWLLNYCKTENNRSSMQQHESHKEHLIQQQVTQAQANAVQQAKELQVEQQQLQVELEFQQQIRNHLFHQEFLVKEFCDYLVQRGLTGVYVGYVDFPSKQLQDADDDENGHLEIDQPKLIKYIGANESHIPIMLNKTLALESGVTGEVFKEVPPPDDPTLPTPSSVVYIPAVTKEPRMVYFQWPKLGAFLAVPLIYNSCLFPGSLDAGVEERLRFKRAAQEKVAEKEQRLLGFQEKLKEAQEAEQDLEPINQEMEQYLADWKEEEENAFQSQKRQFVVCFDTLGQDREISKEDREYFESYVYQFGEYWQQTENKLLSDDIDLMITYLEQGAPKDRSEQLTIQEDSQVEQSSGQFEEMKEREKEYTFEIQSFRLSVILTQIGTTQQEFYSLKNYRVIKYPGILQGLLLFLGYTKEQVCQVGTNLLDWNRVKEYINEDLYKQICDYNHRGAKSVEVLPYAKLNRISRRMSKFTVEQVEEYNVSYAKILKWLQLVIKLRVMDIEIRRERIVKLRASITTAQEEVQKIKDDKELKFEEHKASLSPEEQETLVKEQWEVQYDEEHPLPNIPNDVDDELDQDLDDE